PGASRAPPSPPRSSGPPEKTTRSGVAICPVPPVGDDRGMSSPGPRARARAQTIVDIKRVGREHLASQGAAALSLRAVARDLGMVSSAIYRYVRSRDELL